MLVEAEIWTIARNEQGNAVLVRPLGSDSAVPIFIGQLEAQSILIGMGNVPMPRPLTHDLFLTLFKRLKAEVERIEITSLKEGTFFSRIIIKFEEEEHIIDARPSDALGIATRCKCPIFIDEAIVDEAGILLSNITEKRLPSKEEVLESELHLLQKELEKAVDLENYEEAARLRDLIKRLSEGLGRENDNKEK